MAESARFFRLLTVSCKPRPTTRNPNPLYASSARQPAVYNTAVDQPSALSVTPRGSAGLASHRAYNSQQPSGRHGRHNGASAARAASLSEHAGTMRMGRVPPQRRELNRELSCSGCRVSGDSRGVHASATWRTSARRMRGTHSVEHDHPGSYRVFATPNPCHEPAVTAAWSPRGGFRSVSLEHCRVSCSGPTLKRPLLSTAATGGGRYAKTETALEAALAVFPEGLLARAFYAREAGFPLLRLPARFNGLMDDVEAR